MILCYRNLLLGGGVQRLLFPPWKPIKMPLQTKKHHDHSDGGGSRNSSSAISGNDSDNIEIDVLLKQLQVLKVTCTTIVSI